MPSKNQQKSSKPPKEEVEVARPQLQIDPDLVKRLASIMCTMDEIAATVGCSVDTLERRFAEVIKTGQMEGRMSLRRAQFQSATGRPGREASYLKDKDGTLVRDERGQPIQTAPYQEPVRANVTAQIWLGKQWLGQSDKLTMAAGEGFEFGK